MLATDHHRPGRAWLVPAVVAAALAARSIVEWLAIASSGTPIGYGEGAVAHAGQLLARGIDPYAVDQPGLVSANYPPLAYAVVALGTPLGPFTGLRVANVIAACAVAIVIGWAARTDRAVAVTLGASFLALYPVWLWVPSNRVDTLAVALTLGAVVSLRAGPRGAAAFGLLGALALLAKPTAALPLGAVVAYGLWRDARTGALRAAALALAASAALVALLAVSDPAGLYEHLVVHNAFPYDPRNPALLIVLAAVLIGAFVALAAGYGDGLGRAYLAGAAGVVLLGGHEGATINYLLDLAAASCLAIAPLARRVSRWAPPLLAGQLLATLALSSVGPFARAGLEAHAARAAIVEGLPRGGLYYAEDSALLVAAGIEPYIDDTYVWAHQVALGRREDDVTPKVESRSFAAVIADVPLDAIGRAPQFNRDRWPPALVEAVLREYTLDASARGAYRYVPRRR